MSVGLSISMNSFFVLVSDDYASRKIPNGLKVKEALKADTHFVGTLVACWREKEKER